MAKPHLELAPHELPPARPTQHKRLEALMQLREWLADKATPDEIEALLREE